ncbi:MAG: hypothetical protein FWG03_04420 [Clostridiales bacterium]|nr:hypothetical protein [Clostridiales bacterium]
MAKNRMNMRERTLWVTRTAIFTALLLMGQFATAPLGNQYVTGSIVNMVLIVSVLVCGMATGITVAVVSPVCAILLGLGPAAAFPLLLPFIMAGNIVFVLAWFAFSRFGRWRNTQPAGQGYRILFYATPALAALAKFLALYTGVVLVAVPYVLGLAEGQSAVVSLMFSYPQLITAAIGGALALAVMPPLRKALKLAQ